MAKRLYIHIGAHKTGTTALQNSLAINRIALQSAGILYPGKSENHYQIAQELKVMERPSLYQDTNLHDVFTEINGNSNSFEKFVLSSEGFWELPSLPRVKMLHDALEFYELNFEVRIVLYCRRQDTWLESAYQQQVKQANVRSVQSFKKFIESKRFFSLIDYYRIIKLWAEVFGHENIIVRIYDSKRFTDDLFNDFYGLLELPGSADFIKPSPASSNIGLKVETVEFLRLINLLKVENEDYEKIFKILSDYELKTAGNYKFLNAELAEEILEHFKDSNKKLAEEYLDVKETSLFMCSHNNEGNIPFDQPGIHTKLISVKLELIGNANNKLLINLYRFLLGQSHLSAEPERVRQAFLASIEGIIKPDEKADVLHEFKLSGNTSYSIKQQFDDSKTVIRITPKNFFRKVAGFSKDIQDNVKTQNDQVIITSRGRDPYFNIVGLAGKNINEILISISVEVPEDTILNIYYQTRTDPNYSDSKTLKRNVYKGKNKLYLKLDESDFNGNMRIDPGMVKGIYKLDGIFIKATPDKKYSRRVKRK